MRTLMGLLALVWLAGPAWSGEITGKVAITSKVAPRAVGKKDVRYQYKDADLGDQGGLAPGAKVNETDYVVISLVGKGLKATSGGKAVMSQKNKDFDPHVLAVVKGTSVRFENDDRIFHHIYSVSEPGAFEIKKYRGKFEEKKFADGSPVEIFCGIHPRMNAYVFVAENDFFTMAKNGKFALRNVPEGKYTVRAWHPRLKQVEQTVTVPKSGSVEVNFEL